MESVIERQFKKIKRDTEERSVLMQAKKEGLLYADLETYSLNTKALSLVPYIEAQKALVVPINIQLKKVFLAVVDLHTQATQDIISQLTSRGYALELYLVSHHSLLFALHIYDALRQQQEGISDHMQVDASLIQELFQRLKTLDTIRDEVHHFSEATDISYILTVFLTGAFLNNVSDIHFETKNNPVRVRYRIDGLLYDITDTLSYNHYTALVSRIKLLSHLKLNVKEFPQEGRASIKFGDDSLNLRISIIPSDFGETIVIRLLRSDSLTLSLSSLGLRSDDLDIVRQELHSSHGMILTTGPTGSGKTTTLYSFLLEKRSPEIKIITIEDPIEYTLLGIEQTQVEKNSSYTFTHGLPALLRQDPDVILIGEIRDSETARTSVEAALTGHLVFSTIHANSASGVIPRLLFLHVDPTSISSALRIIIAQRLVRKLCSQCRVKNTIDSSLQEKIGVFLAKLPDRVITSHYQNPVHYTPGSCEACHATGYNGRIGLFELLRINSELQKLIHNQLSEIELHQLALKQGMVTLQQDGLLKVLSGITSFTELERVTGEIAWG